MGRYRLTIRLNINETIFVEGEGLIDHDELISQRIESVNRHYIIHLVLPENG